MTRTRILSAALTLAALSSLLLNCHDSTGHHDYVDNNNYIAEADFHYDTGVTNQVRLRIQGVSGSITINGREDFDSVIVEGVRSVGSETLDDAEEHLPYLQVEFEVLSSEIRVKTIQPDNSYGRSYVVDYEITLPYQFEVIASSVNASVSVDSINSNLTISNVNGQVYLDNIIGSVAASLVNGTVTASITIPSDGIIAITNVNGGIDLSIPVNTSADFEASLVNGNIYISNLDFQNEQITNHSVEGTLGSGDGDIALTTVNGNITARGF